MEDGTVLMNNDASANASMHSSISLSHPPSPMPSLSLRTPVGGRSHGELLAEAQEVSQRLRGHVMRGDLATYPRRALHLDLLTLRQLNRQLASILVQFRHRIASLKVVLDRLHTKLLGHKYEQVHLLEAIRTRLHAQNLYTSIELDEHSWPPEFAAMDEHAQMLAKLRLELTQRQELQQRLAAILQQRLATETVLADKRRKFDELRAGLQSLLKGAKPVIEASGFDPEQRRVKAAQQTDNQADALPNGGLSGLHEKLVAFVAERPGFKLRYFNPLSRNEKGEEGEEEGEEGHDRRHDSASESDRNPAIPDAHIHLVAMDDEPSIAPADVFVTLHEDGRRLMLTLEHELLSAGCLDSWLTSLPLEDSLLTHGGTNVGGWIDFNWLQAVSGNSIDPIYGNENDCLATVFAAIRTSLLIRAQLQSALVRIGESLASCQLGIAFDRVRSNSIVLSDATSGDAIFVITLLNDASSTRWDRVSSARLSNVALDPLNALSTKYRSAVDCLHAQVSLLLEQLPSAKPSAGHPEEPTESSVDGPVPMATD